jgi:hypothetical protein
MGVVGAQGLAPLRERRDIKKGRPEGRPLHVPRPRRSRRRSSPARGLQRRVHAAQRHPGRPEGRPLRTSPHPPPPLPYPALELGAARPHLAAELVGRQRELPRPAARRRL